MSNVILLVENATFIRSSLRAQIPVNETTLGSVLGLLVRHMPLNRQI